MSDVRDNKGRFTKGTPPPSPEHRAKMQAAKAAKQGFTADLLESVGLTIDNAPPELLVIAKKAAGGDMPAMRLFLSQTKQLVRKESQSKPQGDTWNIVLSQETVEYLVEHGMEFTLCPRCERLASVGNEDANAKR